jgi:hypothetical protein
MATGPELVTNGTFDTDTSGWTESGSTLSINNQALRVTQSTAQFASARQVITGLVIGKTYKINVGLRSVDGVLPARMYLRPIAYDNATGQVPTSDATSTSFVNQVYIYVATSTELYLRATCNSNTVIGSVEFDNISVKELTAINTCSLYQDSLGTTPVTAVGQPVGLMLDRSKGGISNTNLYTGGNITGVPIGGPAFTNYPLGFSSVAGKAYRISIDVTGYSGTGTYSIAGVTGTDWILLNPQTGDRKWEYTVFALTSTAFSIFTRSTNTANFSNISVKEIAGTHAIQSTAINRPTLQVDLNGNYYLSANGTNTTMRTANNLDMSGSDAVMLIAGVRKNNTSSGVIAELSTDYFSFPGTFLAIANPGVSPNINTYGWRFAGSTFDAVNGAINTPSVFPAPISNVFTGQSEISPSINIIRIDGTQQIQTTPSSGTGNLGSYPLFLFARASTSVFFNGRLYGLIVRGTATTDSIRAKAEKYMTKETLLTATPMLDGITSGVALSLRKVYSNYTGPCLRVRNSSTNVETEIGFAEDGWIDQSALLAATGANSGFVVRWYDQSGGGRNATQ